MTALVGVVAVQLTAGAGVAECRETVPLQIISSTEKWEIIAELADNYNAENRPDGLCPHVTVTPLTSGAAELALEEGWNQSSWAQCLPKPDVWTPTTSMWVNLLTRRQKDIVRPPDNRFEGYPVLARSPVIVAMPKAKADALRKALGNDTFDWDDLRLLAAQSWGQPGTLLRDGRTEWGRFWLRKDNPRTSSSGLAATIATYHAAHASVVNQDPAGVRDIPPKQLTNKGLTDYIREVEASVDPSGYVTDATEMVKSLALEDENLTNANGAGGWREASAIVVQEQFVYLYNINDLPFTPGEARPRRPPTQPLMPLYPASGTLVMDHPYVMMTGLSRSQERVAEDFRAYLQEHREVFVRNGFRDAGGDLRAPLRDQLEGGVNSPDLLQYPTGNGIQTILDSWQTLRKRGRLLILLDTSGTMNDPYIGAGGLSRLMVARAALATAADEAFNRGDRVELRKFPGESGRMYDTIYPVQGNGDAEVGEKRLLLNVIRAAEATGPTTPLYESIRRAYRDMRERPAENEIGAVIVITDGAENNEAGSKESVLGEIRATDSNVRIYSILFGPKKVELTKTIEDLTEISKETGGDLFVATHDGETTLSNAFRDALSVV